MTAFSWYLAWVLLPLVPAILLYLIFPKSSQASIETPATGKPAEGKGENMLQKLTKGFAIKLGGAVAVYFLVFYLINPVKNKWYEKSVDTWELNAYFRDIDGNPIPVSKLENIEVIPDIAAQQFDDTTTKISLTGVTEEGNITYSIRLSYAGYESITLPLEDSLGSNSYCNKIKDKKQFITRVVQKIKPRVKQQGDDLPIRIENLAEKIIN